jgi:hypothetical protein
MDIITAVGKCVSCGTSGAIALARGYPMRLAWSSAARPAGGGAPACPRLKPLGSQRCTGHLTRRPKGRASAWRLDRHDVQNSLRGSWICLRVKITYTKRRDVISAGATFLCGTSCVEDVGR